MGVGHRLRPFDTVDSSWVAGSECDDIASFEAPFDRVYNSIEREYRERVTECEERQRLSFVTSADAQKARGGPMTGRERWAKLNEALNGFGLTRSKNQRWYVGRRFRSAVEL